MLLFLLRLLPKNGRCLHVVFPDVSAALFKSLHSLKPNTSLDGWPSSINLPAPTI